MSPNGDVIFGANGAIWSNSLQGITVRKVNLGDAVPAPVGGTILAVTPIQFNSAGDICFRATIAGSGVSSLGLFRLPNGGSLEIIAYANQAAPGVAGPTFSSFSLESMNNNGVVSFRSQLSNSQFGIFQKEPGESVLKVVIDGENSSLSGGGTYSFSGSLFTRTLSNATVSFSSSILNGTAIHAEHIAIGGVVNNIFSTNDLLPSGARNVIRTFKVTGSGNCVGFVIRRAGGHSSVAVHNLANSVSSILATDGEAAPGINGGRIRILNTNSVFLKEDCSAAIPVTLLGGSAASTTAILGSIPGSGLYKIAVAGDPGPGATTISSITNPSFDSVLFNPSGKVAFIGRSQPGNTLTLFLWNGASLDKIAAVGDAVPGGTLSNITDFALNGSDEVAFRAQVNANSLAGIFIGAPGGPISKAALQGDAGPGASTFLGFSKISFNDLGQVAFKASLSGGPAGGLFVSSSAGSPTTIALDGTAAPAGGNYSVSGTQPDILINSQEDVVFRSSLTGGSSDSGYFIKRGPSAPVEAIALQGSPAPGTLGVFGTFFSAVNGLLSEQFQLGPEGEVSILANVIENGETRSGAWVVRTDGSVEAVFLRFMTRPEFGGGKAASIVQGPFSWNSGQRLPLNFFVAGGNFFQGIFVAQPSTSPECDPIPAVMGQAVSDALNGSSCNINTSQTGLYTFSGTAGQKVAIALETTSFVSKLELLGPQGSVVAIAGGVSGGTTSRLPSSGYLTLPSTGVYTIRAISPFGGLGQYTLSVFEEPVQTCEYAISPTESNIPPSGGPAFFDVFTQPGCPPAALPASSGSIYENLTYSGGRVAFNVSENTGGPRQETITVAGKTHAINQFGVAPPANDGFGSAQAVTGANSPAGNPVTGYNTTATTDGGEPGAGGNTPAKSVWYTWTAPESGLYSFSTSGSNFDTVMAIYECPLTGECTFASLLPVGSNDDTTFFDLTSKVNFRAVKDTVYRIVVDGKNGLGGTIELSWRQYERLFRLYLQNYNGNQTTIVPDSVTASNGSNTVIPTLVSIGVYEFNLPADNTVYSVNITGPAGIVWNPNGFPLDTLAFASDKLMLSTTTELGQNSVSNATNQTPRYIYGFIKQITQQELGGLSVMIGSSRGPNPRDPAQCSPLAFTSISSVPYATYQCISQPQTLHDIIPRRAGKKFTISVLSFENPITTTYNGTVGNSFLATNVPTHNITGQVQAGGAGTVVDLSFTPEGLSGEIALRTVTGADGSYSFPDLPANTYKVKASREGFVFAQPPPIDLQSSQLVNISAQTTCTYTPADLTQAPGTGGPGKFTINTNDPTCTWQAKSDVPWLVINSGVGVGNGPVHFTALANDGSARTGGISINGLAVPVSIEQGGPFATVSGQVFTPGGQAVRNALVSIVDQAGVRRTTLTSSLGFYSFDNVATGVEHSMSVTTKRYRFQPRIVNLTFNLSNVHFIGLE